MKHYRALISVPVHAESDAAAVSETTQLAHALLRAGVVIGHLEMVGEVRQSESMFQITRVVLHDRLVEHLSEEWR